MLPVYDLYLLDSASHFSLNVNSVSLSSGRRAFSITGRSPVRRSGTRCLTSSELRRVVLTVFSSFLRQSCLVFTNVTSALGFLNVMRYINPRFTYLLTIRQNPTSEILPVAGVFWWCTYRLYGYLLFMEKHGLPS